MDEDEIQDELVTKAVQNWLESDNPFSDIVIKDELVETVSDELGPEVSENDVAYAWKLMTEEGYFRKRGKSRRITAKEIDHAENLGVETPIDRDVLNKILEVLKKSEKEDVDHPQVSREELLEELDYDEEVVDYNVFYCRSKNWAEVSTYISSQPWHDVEITRFGRNKV